MATFEMFLEQRMKKIKAVVNQGLKEVVGTEIKESILYRLETNFYSMGYGNRGELAKSIRVMVLGGKVGSEFTVEVYFDDARIRHTSWFGSEKLGIQPGDTVYTVQWINDGWTYVHGSKRERLRDLGVTPHFLEDALRDLEMDKSWIGKFHNYLRANGIDIE